MLDYADFVERYDKQDTLGAVAKEPSQLEHRFEGPEGVKEITRLDSIVCAGMGGTALAAEMVKSWLGDRLIVPFEIVRGYELPRYVREDTLVVCSSYSGNTEETVAVLGQALERKAPVVVIAAGGKLLEVAKEKGLPYFVLPKVPQPRLSVFYGVRAWAQLLEGMDLLDGLVGELEAAAKWAVGEVGAWVPERPTGENAAKQIAAELVGHPVLVYAGPALAAAAYKWKVSLNEYAKNLAFYNVLPELNHNELTGWGHPERSGVKVVELRSGLDNPRVMRRFDETNRLLSNVFAPIEVEAAGKTRFEQQLWAVMLGEFTAAYLALLNQVDPMSEEVANKFKQAMG